MNHSLLSRNYREHQEQQTKTKNSRDLSLFSEYILQELSKSPKDLIELLRDSTAEAQRNAIISKMIQDFKNYVALRQVNSFHDTTEFYREILDLDDTQLQVKLLESIFECVWPRFFLQERICSLMEKEFVYNGQSVDCSDLWEKLIVLDVSTLNNMLSSFSKRCEFLHSVGKIDDTKKQHFEDTFENHRETLLENIFQGISWNNFSQEDKEALLEIFSKMLSWEPIQKEDIETFVILLDISQDPVKRKAFLEYFSPAWKVQDLVRLGVLTEQEGKQYTWEGIRGAFPAVFEPFLQSKEHQENMKILKNIRDFVYFDVEKLTDQQREVFFQTTNKDDFYSEIAKSYRTQVSERSKTYEDFDTFKKSLISRFPALKPLLDTFEPWKYFVMRKGQGQNTRNYVWYIDAFDQQWVHMINLSYKDDMVVALHKGIQEHYSYAQLEKIFEDIAANSLLSSCEVHTGDSLSAAQIVPFDFEATNIVSVSQLKAFLDELDPEGKDVSPDAMALTCKRPMTIKWNFLNDEEVYIVKRIDENEKKVYVEGEERPFNFSEFVSVFSLTKAKRRPRVWNVESLWNTLIQKPYTSQLEDYIVENGKIIDKHTKQEVRYFLSDKNKVLRVVHWWDTGVDIEVGTIVTSDTWDGRKQFKKESHGKGMKYNDILLFFESQKLVPLKEPITEYVSKNPKKGSVLPFSFKFSVSVLTLREVLSGISFFANTLESALKEGNRLNSLRFSQWIGKALSHILPSQMQLDLRNMVENEEKKIRNERMDRLKSMNTDEMIKRIEYMLFHSSPFSMELEVALMTVISRYGVLYPKGLSKYSGTFAWYKALGGKIGDQVYREYKRKCEENTSRDENGKTKPDPLPFTEEWLIEALLSAQVKQWLRRSKFDREYKSFLLQGLDGEMKDGDERTQEYPNAEWRVQHVINNLKDGQWANAIGGIENILKKWPDPDWLMAAIPFVFVTTGASINLPPLMLDKVKKYAFVTPLFFFAFIGNNEKKEVFNNAVSRVIELRFWKSHRCFREWNRMLQETNISKKIEYAYSFWKEYGPDLYSTLNFKDGFIESRKDHSDNTALKLYFENVEGIQSMGVLPQYLDASYLREWWVDFANHPLVFGKSFFEDPSRFRFTPSGGYHTVETKKLFHMILEYFENTICHGNFVAEENREKMFKDAYKFIEREVLWKNIYPFIQRYGEKNYKSWECYQDAKKHGIDLFLDDFLQEDGTFDEKRYESEVLDVKWKEFQNKKQGKLSIKDLSWTAKRLDEILQQP